MIVHTHFYLCMTICDNMQIDVDRYQLYVKNIQCIMYKGVNKNIFAIIL